MTNMADRTTESVQPPAPYGPTPTQRQLLWSKMEFYGFLHFTVNTFTDKEWGYGDESPEVFNPKEFDAEQIISVAADGGMTGLILTCKHHDGFCLWPSRFTEHSVKNSRWRNGRGDVVIEIAKACAGAGLKFGVYLSPWDRNHARYGFPEYVTYYREQLRELLTEYGELFEVWFDGANGGDGYYGGARETRRIDAKSYYGWDETWNIVRNLQPDACMFSDIGPDIRWVGNEKGIAGDPCWHTIGESGFWPGNADVALLNSGERDGTKWLPAECDVSIRPGWFYHPSENEKVRAPDNLLDLYFKSVGRGASLLLNLPPDRRGKIHENDSASLIAFRKRLDGIYENDLARNAAISADNTRGDSRQFGISNLVDGDANTYWATDDGIASAEIILAFGQQIDFNIISIREHIPLGQRIDRFAVFVDGGSGWREYARGESIGNRRIVRGRKVRAERIKLAIEKAAACPAISEIGIYME